jgi:hypothetical protein
MKGGRISMPQAYFSGANSKNYSEAFADSHTQGGQQGCTNSYGPDLQVGGRKSQRRRRRRRVRLTKAKSQKKTQAKRRRLSKSQRMKKKTSRKRRSMRR